MRFVFRFHSHLQFDLIHYNKTTTVCQSLSTTLRLKSEVENLKERFDSDRTVVSISEESGLVAIDDAYKHRSYCPVSSDDADISRVEMAYAFKLILDEFKSMGIYPKLELTEKY